MVAETKEAFERTHPADLARERVIQGGSVTRWRAILQAIPHFAGHTQEIICFTRMQLCDAYQFHWTPPTP